METVGNLDPALLGQSRQTSTLVAVWVCVGIATVFVGMRMFSRWFLTRNAGWDDHLMLASMILQLAFVGMTTVSIEAGVGRHMAALTPQQMIKSIKFSIVGQPISVVALCLPKISVAMLIRRFMPSDRVSDWRMLIIYFLCASLTILGVVGCILEFVQCDPISAVWLDTKVVPKCWPADILKNLNIGFSAYSAFTDLYLAFFPAVIFWRLNIKLRTKIALSAVMSLGVLAAICSIIKCTFFQTLEGGPSDLTWKDRDLILWANIEADTVIVAACIPTLRPFLMWILGKPLTTSRIQSNSKRNGYKHFDDSRGTSPGSKKSELYHHHLQDLGTDGASVGNAGRLNSADPTLFGSANGTSHNGGIHRTMEIHTAVEHV